MLLRTVSGSDEVFAEDRSHNVAFLRARKVLMNDNGLRLLSAYQLADGQKLWIITEADRSCTTLLLPEEY
jgi:hypothetical protein